MADRHPMVTRSKARLQAQSRRVTRSQNRSFQDLPPELRRAIYEQGLQLPQAQIGPYQRWKKPPFLAVFSRNARLYEEALEWFYKHNDTHINCVNYHQFQALSAKSWRTIRHLSICLEYNNTTAYRNFLTSRRSPLNLAKNIRTLQFSLYVSDLPDPHRKDARPLVRSLMLRFRGGKKIRRIGAIIARQCHCPGATQTRRGIVQDINAKLRRSKRSWVLEETILPPSGQGRIMSVRYEDPEQLSLRWNLQN